MSALETLQLEQSGAIARIELARPDKRNAMSPTMAEELSNVLDTLEEDKGVRVVMIRGAGGNFCSGGDRAPDG